MKKGKGNTYTFRVKPLVAVIGAALLTTACGDDDSSRVSVIPPYEPNQTINTSGGNGGNDGGDGAEGGYVEFYKSNGMGNVEVRKTGQADASFTPASVTAYLGENPLIVSADTTIVSTSTEPAAGTLYTQTNDYWGCARVSDENGVIGDEDCITGIRVDSGATLTLAPNYYDDYASFWMQNDLDNRGKITTGDTASHRGGVHLSMASYVGTGSIDTSGNATMADAGMIEIDADYSLINHGAMTAKGASTTSGDAGYGNGIYFYGDFVQNTAALDSSGGKADAGQGGSAGSIEMDANYGELSNSGSLTSAGGDGTTGAGGGGDVDLYADDIGVLRNSGVIMAAGGNAGADGYGGYGGDVYMEAYGGHIISSANITTRGGNTASESYGAGSGGYINFYTYDGYIYETTPAGEIVISGNLDTSGGSAPATGSGYGGYGGSVYAEVDSDYSVTQRIALLGYSNIITKGGDANYPSHGGGVEFYAYNYSWDAWIEASPSGSVVNEANINTRGGNVVADATSAAAGASGGSVNLETGYDLGAELDGSEFMKVVNSGAIDTRTGSSNNASYTNYAGDVWIWGYNGVTNSGAIDGSGADDSASDGGTEGRGGNGNGVEMYAELGPVENSAALNANGGYGEYVGGYSGDIDMYAPVVKNSGNLSANGGSANPALTDSYGEEGGWIELYSPKGPQGVTNSGTISVASGAGYDDSAEDGTYVIGGMCVGNWCN